MSFNFDYTAWLVVLVHHLPIIEDAHHHPLEEDLALPDAVHLHPEDARHRQEGAMTTAKDTEIVQMRDTVAIHPMVITDNKEAQTLMVLPFVQRRAIQICK